jgi:hypothetical protein
MRLHFLVEPRLQRTSTKHRADPRQECAHHSALNARSGFTLAARRAGR